MRRWQGLFVELLILNYGCDKLIRRISIQYVAFRLDTNLLLDCIRANPWKGFSMRPYEVGVILRADLSNDALTGLMETVKGWIESNDGVIDQVNNWGRRRLAYPINKQRDGYYVFFKTSMPPSSTSEIERNLRLSENVLRFLVIREEE